jgi:SAM-dependent methyltransferase
VALARRLRRSPTLRRWLGFEETIWTRKAVNEAVRKLVGALEPASLRALEISGAVWKNYGFKSYRSAGYPDLDICEASLGESFDLVIAEHVFEHLLWPYRAGRHVLQMVEPGGHFLMVTPFIYKFHPDPYDCTRWTETGIRYFLAECGFPLERIQTGSWGNRECIEATFRREYRLFNRHLHRLGNDPALPLVVWALAERAR